MKLIAIAVVMMMCGCGWSQGPDGSVTLEASLAVAKKVCAAHADAEVWIFNPPSWNKYYCSTLGGVFAVDSNNAFDSMIPLMQSINDKPAAPPAPIKRPHRIKHPIPAAQNEATQ